MTSEQYEQCVYALKTLAKQPDGQRALAFIVKQLPLYEPNFSGNPYKDAYINGRREVALTLRNIIGPELFERLVTFEF